MTYDPVTHKRYCNVCGAEVRGRSYYTYDMVRKKRTVHVCLACHDRGSYWCPVCEDVHASGGRCPQQQLPPPF